jgi:hypothetical protein
MQTFAIPLFFVLGVLPLLSHDHHRDGCGHDCDWNHGHRIQNRSSNLPSSSVRYQTLDGTIAEINYLPGSAPADVLIDVRLRFESKMTLVRMGPASFLKRAGLTLKHGDRISLTGFPVTGVEGDLIVCTEVHQGQKVVRLRDGEGRPLW